MKKPFAAHYSMAFCMFLGAFGAFRPGAAEAAYPCSTVRWIIPFAPGGAVDLQTRKLADKLGPALGVSIVAENRAGAGGTAGAEFVAKSKPDGCTLVTVSSSHVVAQLESGGGYDLVKDFAPVSYLISSPYFITVSGTVNAKTLPELIALAKAQPGKFNFATTGKTSLQALLGARLKSDGGIDIVPVGYKGSGEQISDVVSGRTQIVFAFPSVVQSYVDEGKMRFLAVSSAKRLDKYPDLPTASETLPGFELKTSYGVLVRAGTPSQIVKALSAGITNILNETSFRSSIIESGFEVVAGSADDYGKQIRAEMTDFAKLLEIAAKDAK